MCCLCMFVGPLFAYVLFACICLVGPVCEVFGLKIGFKTSAILTVSRDQCKNRITKAPPIVKSQLPPANLGEPPRVLFFVIWCKRLFFAQSKKEKEAYVRNV